MQPITNLSTIITRYDAILMDLWGVIHDGTHLYPGVGEALLELRKAKKKIIMVSNAPRRAEKAARVLSQLGVAAEDQAAIASFTLIEATEQHPPTETWRGAFSLIFHGPPDLAFGQGMVSLRNPDFGVATLFIVPVGANNDARMYQAVFN